MYNYDFYFLRIGAESIVPAHILESMKEGKKLLSSIGNQECAVGEAKIKKILTTDFDSTTSIVDCVPHNYLTVYIVQQKRENTALF